MKCMPRSATLVNAIPNLAYLVYPMVVPGSADTMAMTPTVPESRRKKTVTDSRLGVIYKSQSGRLLAAIAIIAVLHFAAEIIVPFALAILLSFLLSPLADRLEKWHFGRIPSVVLVVIAAAVLTGAIAWLVAAQLLDVAEQLPQYRTNIHEKIQALRGMKSSGLGKATQTVHELNQ